MISGTDFGLMQEQITDLARPFARGESGALHRRLRNFRRRRRFFSLCNRSGHDFRKLAKMTIKNLVLGVCGFCLLTILYYYVFRTSPRFSDDASLLLAGSEMIEGNWRLHGWWLPIDNFWTNDIPLYALLAKLQGLRPVIMLQLPVLLWSLLCIVCLTLARTGLCKENRAWATVALATPILLPVITDNGGMLQIAHAPIHVETTVGVLICFLLLKLFIDQDAYRRLLITMYGAVMTILLVADPLAIFIGVLPILCVAIFGAMLDRKPVRFWVMAAVTL